MCTEAARSPRSVRAAPRYRVVMAAAGALGLGAVCATGCATDPGGGALPPVANVAGSVFGAAPADGNATELRPAVTHLGREVLPRVGLVVRGSTIRLSRALGGVEVVRFHVDEVLRSVPWDRVPSQTDDPVLTVFCGESGMLPATGEEAVLLVARRLRSPNHDVVQVIDVSGRDGPERLEALRAYLAIEEVPNESDRVAALRDHLRAAVRDRRKWIRSNAALEYGSLAVARPLDLGADDAAVLRAAVLGARERDVRRALRTALAVAERNAHEAPRITISDARPDSADDAPTLEAFMLRFLENRDAMERRKVVVNAAVALEDGAVPLLRRALADADPRVRDAAIASAGELRLTTLGPDLVPMLAGDEPLPVKRSLVRALGYLREASGVPTLQPLGRASGDLGDDACYALARIRNQSAVAALGRLLSSARGERRDLLEFLLSDAFVEQEASLGRVLD